MDSITGILLVFVTLWKANRHININENVKIVVNFLFKRFQRLGASSLQK